MKPFSQACENNKHPILNVITEAFADRQHVLEIGSGTGQHAVFFAKELPHLHWQPSDRGENVQGIQQWCKDCPSPNLGHPAELDVLQQEWPTDYDAVYSANTAHIMPWVVVKVMLEKIGENLPSGGKFALYGPFNYDGDFTSDSNREFDAYLKATNPNQGIRDFDAINTIATHSGLILLADHALPANNRLIIWQKD